MDILSSINLQRQSQVDGWPSLDDSFQSYTSKLESRLALLEWHIEKLLNWQSAIAAATVKKLPGTPPLETQVFTEDHLNIKKEPTTKLTKPAVSNDRSQRTKPERRAKYGNADHQFENTSTSQAEISTRALTTEVVKRLAVDVTVANFEQKAIEKDSTRLAYRILDIVQQYGQHIESPSESGTRTDWAGKSRFVHRVEEQIENDLPIKMILPAFPWKSINRNDKVNGILPDLGEVLALARLNHLCEDIETVYPKGGQVTIATDGLVFDDIVGIPDEDTWAYSDRLMVIAAERGFKNIRLLRVMDILGLMKGRLMTKEIYLSLAATCRSMLLEHYGRSEDEVREMMQTDSDTLLTYRGFIRFLETDLKYSPIAKHAVSGTQFRKCVKKVATGMMVRAESFTKLLAEKCPEYVRLSIHPSTGAVKLSIPLIIQASGEFPKTPWHCTIALGLDGSYSTVHSKDVRDTHNLIYHGDQPFYYREKSDLWDWNDDVAAFEPLYPNKLLVHPAGSRVKTLEKGHMDKLRELATLFQGRIEVISFTNSADVFPAASA